MKGIKFIAVGMEDDLHTNWFTKKVSQKYMLFDQTRKKGNRLTIYSMEIFDDELEYVGWNKTNWLSNKNCHLLVYFGKPFGLSDLI